MRRLPLSGTLFLAGFLAITGSPPFGPFISEFSILNGAFDAGRFVTGGLFLFLLLVVFIGMGATVLKVVQGRAPAEARNTPYRDGLLTAAPVVVLMGIVLLLGLYIPAPLDALAQRRGPIFWRSDHDRNRSPICDTDQRPGCSSLTRSRRLSFDELSAGDSRWCGRRPAGRVRCSAPRPSDPAATQLYVVLADDEQNQLYVGRTQIEGDRFPSLTPRCPQVHLFEREIAEQFGLKPIGHPWLKPVRYHRS